jgi:hypothetical protein
MLAAAVMHLVCLKQQADVIKRVSESGRCLTVAESPDAKTRDQARIAPGQPPLLMFRYYEGKLHHRFGNSDLMLDDAGH